MPDPRLAMPRGLFAGGGSVVLLSGTTPSESVMNAEAGAISSESVMNAPGAPVVNSLSSTSTVGGPMPSLPILCFPLLSLSFISGN